MVRRPGLQSVYEHARSCSLLRVQRVPESKLRGRAPGHTGERWAHVAWGRGKLEGRV